MAAQDTDLVEASVIARNGVMRLKSRARDVGGLLRAYVQRPDVLYAEPNYIWYPSDLPNDAFFNQQWGLRNTGQRIQDQLGIAGADIRAVQAWDVTEGSRQIVVGVVDSGIDASHPDLAVNLWSAPAPFTVLIAGESITCAAGTHGFNAIARTCAPHDESGHGTVVAGIIGAAGNNGIGISGVSRVASMMDLKFMGTNGGSTADAVAAIDFAIQVKALFGPAANVRILNNSWGGLEFSNVLLDAVRSAELNDMLFVAASGNDHQNTDLLPHYPSNYSVSNVISIAATDNKDDIASFSNFGSTSVHLGAPGNEVLSTAPSGLYEFADGTSVAAPMVSGAAALVLSACSLSTTDLKSNLIASADAVSSLKGKTVSGGRLNVSRALSNCGAGSTPSFKLAVTPGAQAMETNGSATFSVTVISVNGFAGPIGLTAVGLPAGMTATFNPAVVSGDLGTSTLTLTTNAAVQTGTFVIGINGASGSVTKVSGVSVTVGSSIGPGQTIAGALSTTDYPSSQQPHTYTDTYRLTIGSPMQITINLNSMLFDTYLYLLSNSGTILFEDDDGGGDGNSRIIATLSAGTYTIEATSYPPAETGNYTLSINTPVLTDITPAFGSPGSTLTVNISGAAFASPMSATVGGGITVGSVAVASSTSATAILNIPANSSTAPQSVAVTTSAGTSNPLFFTVPPAIAPGQRLPGTLSTNDQVAPNRVYRYADLYRLTLTTGTAVTIDLVSEEFDAYLFLLSSTGSVLFSNDQSGGTENARITATLNAGTYFIEATTYERRETGEYSLSVNLPVLTGITPSFRDQGSSVPVILTGARFTAPMSVQAGAGISVSNVIVTSPTSAAATLTVAGGAPTGMHDVIATTSEGSTNRVGFKVVPTIPSISPGQTVSGNLSSADESSAPFPEAYADLYRLTLTTVTTVSISLRSDNFDSYLYLLRDSGAIISQNDDSGGGMNAAINTTLAPGTYLIEATSFEPRAIGAYTLFLLSSPSLSSLQPDRGAQGTVVGVMLTGNSFAAPLTVNAGSGVTVTNVSVLSPTSAIATFTIAATATTGIRNVTVTTLVGTTSTVPFSVLAPQSTQLQFARTFGPSELMSTGFAVVNPSSAPASVTFTMYNSSGTVVATSNETIPAKGQLAKVGSELFPGATQSGWVRVTSSTVGLQGFWVGGDFANFMDGADGAPVARDIVFPLVTPQTEINVVNPGALPASVTIRVFGTSGTELAAAVNRPIAPNGVFREEVSTIFPGVAFIGATYVRVAGNEAIAGTAVTRDYPFGPSWTVMNGIDAALSVFEANFPHVPSGSQDGVFSWTSIVGIANLSTDSQNVAITFTPKTGDPVQITGTIAGKGILRESAQNLFNFPAGYQDGWVKVSGNGPLAGFLGYGYTGTSGVTVVPVQATLQTTMIFSHVANGPLWSTGLALLNTSTSEANVEVYVMRKTGALVGGAANVPTASFVLPPRTKQARLLTELVPASNADDGFVFIRSTNGIPLYGLQLFFSRDLKLIANIAAGTIDPSLAYTPPAP